MRKLFVALIATFAIAGVIAPAGASAPTKKKPPVKLDGTVNNHGAATVKGGAVDIEQDDLYFESTFLKAKAGSTVKVTLENEGDANHTFTIDGQDVDEELSPGDTVDVNVKIPSNGKPVTFYCRFHVSSGMQGAFYTKSGAAAKSNSNSDSSGGGYGY